MRWPFTRYGTGTLLTSVTVLVAAAAALASALPSPHALWAPVIPALLAAFVLSFFRDPERHAAGGEDELVSPADGLVADIVTVDDPQLGVRAVRIGIFLSVFDVHVNRAPCSGTVTGVHRRDGRFLDARDPRATEENQAATIVLRRPDGRSVAVRQITGLIARRIVCPVREGEALARGERYGMIKFGSRTELIVPEDAVARVLVAPGSKVRGGETRLAEMTATGETAPTGAA